MTQNIPPSIDHHTGRILIVCATNEEANVSREVSRLAHASARQEQRISILAISASHCKNSSYVTAQILPYLGQDLPHLLVPQSIAIHADELNRRAFLLRPAGVKVLLARNLPLLLEQLRLDWMSQVEAMLHNGWRHSVIDRDHIARWKRQFDHCGSHGWVADGLLKNLDFWSDTRLRDALCITPEGLEGIDCLCINRHRRAGKSADVIANLVKKRLDSAPALRGLPLEDFADALQKPQIRSILYVEDCTLSGNEMERVFRGLLGLPDPYGNAKADPLTDPNHLRARHVVLRFAVVGNAALEHLRRSLASWNLLDIHIDTLHSKIEPLMTQEGLTALTTDALYDDGVYLALPDSFMQRAVFRFWADPGKQERAKRFCAEIGRQLFARYFEARGEQKPPRWIEECALGIRSAALTLAFAHSVPKETLPLLWMSGAIQWNGKPFHWRALFESAG